MRRWTFAVAIACGAAVVLLGVKVHGMGHPLRIDLAMGRRLPVLSPRLADNIMALGRGAKFAFFVAVLTGVALALRDRSSAVVAVVAAPVAMALTEWVGKPLAGRVEPLGPGYPSGHVTAAAVIAALIVVIGWRRWGWWGVAALLPVGLGITSYMAITVVQLHFHYFSDAVGGALVGFGTAAAVVSLQRDAKQVDHRIHV